MTLHSPTLRNWQKKLMLLTLGILFFSLSFAQTINISGKVSDGNLPLGKVSIKVLGSPQGTTTNEQGEFKIAVAKGQNLVFTYLGFEEKRIVVGSQQHVEVSLVQSQNVLNEAVVIGYGTKKKLNVTGAISTLSGKELEDRPVTSVSSALQGTMSGVTVTQSSGQPGNDYGTIYVQGMGTLGNTNPMVVVDGVVST